MADGAPPPPAGGMDAPVPAQFSFYRRADRLGVPDEPRLSPRRAPARLSGLRPHSRPDAALGPPGGHCAVKTENAETGKLAPVPRRVAAVACLPSPTTASPQRRCRVSVR